MSGFSFDQLKASFGDKRVIGPLSLKVNDGEHVALVGKSGAGKSTLIKLLYERLTRDASLVPQGLGLVNALPVFHNVFMGQLDQHPCGTTPLPCSGRSARTAPSSATC